MQQEPVAGVVAPVDGRNAVEVAAEEEVDLPVAVEVAREGGVDREELRLGGSAESVNPFPVPNAIAELKVCASSTVALASSCAGRMSSMRAAPNDLYDGYFWRSGGMRRASSSRPATG